MDAGSAFYGEVFGWESDDGGGGESMPYRMFSLDGQVVAGMGPLSPDQADAGQPPVWSSYVIVDDADAVYAKAVELGATPLMECMDIMDAGRMFFMLDPLGAAVGVWQSGTHDGAQIFNVPNAMTWNELGCRDVDTAKSFYTKLLGWEAEDGDFDGFTYTVLRNGDRANGGLMDISGFMPDEVPAHWAAWFLVDDCDAAAARVTAAGGSILREPTTDSVGRSALVADPFGASFGIIATTQVDGQPPR
jgi:predicted enzyme related to lactoylglutathione lyase